MICGALCIELIYSNKIKRGQWRIIDYHHSVCDYREYFFVSRNMRLQRDCLNLNSARRIYLLGHLFIPFEFPVFFLSFKVQIFWVGSTVRTFCFFFFLHRSIAIQTDTRVWENAIIIIIILTEMMEFREQTLPWLSLPFISVHF